MNIPPFKIAPRRRIQLLHAPCNRGWFRSNPTSRRVTRRSKLNNPGVLDEEFWGDLLGLHPELQCSKTRWRSGERATLRILFVENIRENDSSILPISL